MAGTGYVSLACVCVCVSVRKGVCVSLVCMCVGGSVFLQTYLMVYLVFVKQFIVRHLI